MGIDMSVEGLDRVLDMLGRLDEETILKEARRGMQEGLQIIRKEAADNCPVDTSKLSHSIKTRIKMGKGELRGEVYAGAEYAVYVEMGTGPRGEASHDGVDPKLAAKVTYNPTGWVLAKRKVGEDGAYRYVHYTTKGMPARPFLYPAYKANENEVKERIALAVIRAVQKGEGQT